MFSHVVLDSFTPAGIKIFAPLSSKKVYRNFGIISIFVLVVLAIVQNNGAYMKIGIFCFLVSCIINIVCFIIGLIGLLGDKNSHIYPSSLLTLLLDLFLCYLFYRQSSGFSPSVPSTQSA